MDDENDVNTVGFFFENKSGGLSTPWILLGKENEAEARQYAKSKGLRLVEHDVGYDLPARDVTGADFTR